MPSCAERSRGFPRVIGVGLPRTGATELLLLLQRLGCCLERGPSSRAKRSRGHQLRANGASPRRRRPTIHQRRHRRALPIFRRRYSLQKEASSTAPRRHWQRALSADDTSPGVASGTPSCRANETGRASQREIDLGREIDHYQCVADAPWSTSWWRLTVACRWTGWIVLTHARSPLHWAIDSHLSRLPAGVTAGDDDPISASALESFLRNRTREYTAHVAAVRAAHAASPRYLEVCWACGDSHAIVSRALRLNQTVGAPRGVPTSVSDPTDNVRRAEFDALLEQFAHLQPRSSSFAPLTFGRHAGTIAPRGTGRTARALLGSEHGLNLGLLVFLGAASALLLLSVRVHARRAARRFASGGEDDERSSDEQGAELVTRLKSIRDAQPGYQTPPRPRPMAPHSAEEPERTGGPPRPFVLPRTAAPVSSAKPWYSRPRRGAGRAVRVPKCDIAQD